MAATTGLPPASPEPSIPAPATKTLEQILNEIDELKKDTEAKVKELDKIETGRKKAVNSRERSVEGRTDIRGLTERINNLKTQTDAITADPKYPGKALEKAKKNGLKTLSNLTSKLDHADKRLEKVTGVIPMTTAPVTTDPQSTATLPTATPATAPATIAEGESSKSGRSLFSRGSKKKSEAKQPQPPPTTTPGIAALVKPTVETTDKTIEDVGERDEEDIEGEEEGESDEDDDDVVSGKRRESEKPTEIRKKNEPILIDRKRAEVTNIESDESEESDEEDEDDDDGAADRRQLLDHLESHTLTDKPVNDPITINRRSRSPTTPRSSRKAPAVKIDPVPSASPILKKTTSASPLPPPSRTKTPSPSPRHRPKPTKPTRRVEESDEEDEEDSNFEEESEEELRHFEETGDHEEPEPDHDYDEPEDDEANVANAYVQELRTKKYSPGTQFLVTHDLNGTQPGDLTVHRGETVTLIEQRPDDWWLFKHNQTQQQGVVPINHIQILLGQQARRRVKPNTSATTLVDAFKASNSIPAGYIASELAPLTNLEEYQLWRALVPKMTESNLSFSDLHWRPDSDKLHIQEATYQKILTVKECVKIPRIKGEQVRVLDRCVRVCLYDGYEIDSNIYTFRAHVPSKIDDRDLTEDWHFLPNNINTLTDEQSQLLIRSNRSDPNQHIKLLFELSQWCQSTVTQEKCEIACGWSVVPLDDEKPPLVTDTKGYNELLRGGHIDEPNILLDPKYKDLRSNGLTGRIDRFKRARVKFSIESRETDLDILYDNLPIQSLIVPINSIKSIAFFRNELAYQLHKRHHPTGLSTTPIDSIFLSTFFQTLEQPDLIFALRRLYSTRRKRFLTSSASLQQQREEFIKTYELFIYPLLNYRQLPPYDFHDKVSSNERSKLINELINRQLPRKKNAQYDILSVLLDPNLTDKWTPFTTNETSFTLQKYIHDVKSDVVA